MTEGWSEVLADGTLLQSGYSDNEGRVVFHSPFHGVPDVVRLVIGTGPIAWAKNITSTGFEVSQSGRFRWEAIGVAGPRTLKQIQEEIATCEQTLQWLKSEMSGHPDYRHADNSSAGT